MCLLEECRELHLTYSIKFADLLNNRHPRVHTSFREVISKKKSSKANLTNLDKSENNYDLNNRVIVEDYCDQMCSFCLLLEM